MTHEFRQADFRQRRQRDHALVSLSTPRPTLPLTTVQFAKSPELFASTCAELFARMLDTVPTGVQLTEVITPLPAI
jgi:hypothetical protein